MNKTKHKLNHKKILQNRAEAKSAANCFCDNCGENMIFVMEDNYHQFSVTIEDILNCLRVAEKNGAVPELTNEWWNAITNRYHGVRSL